MAGKVPEWAHQKATDIILSAMNEKSGAIDDEALALAISTAFSAPDAGSQDIELAVRDICELSPAPDNGPDTVQVDIQDVRVILERYFKDAAPTPKGE